MTMVLNGFGISSGSGTGTVIHYGLITAKIEDSVIVTTITDRVTATISQNAIIAVLSE